MLPSLISSSTAHLPHVRTSDLFTTPININAVYEQLEHNDEQGNFEVTKIDGNQWTRMPTLIAVQQFPSLITSYYRVAIPTMEQNHDHKEVCNITIGMLHIIKGRTNITS